MSAYPNPTPSSNLRSYYSPTGPGSGGTSDLMPVSGGGFGSNQYFNNIPTFANPGQAPSPTTNGQQPASGNPYLSPQEGSGGFNQGGYGSHDSATNIGHGIMATNLQYPGLSASMADYLGSQMGQGVSPFNLSTMMPTGGQTQPGQLTAGMNPLLQQLMSFFQTGQGGGMPGMSNLANIANNGVSALPEWQSMIAAQQQNIGQNQAQLKEQFAGMGDLAGSPFGNAMSNYMQQTTLDQNSLLGQLQQSNIQNIQMPAINELFSGSQQMASGLQNLDQSAIDKMYQQYQTDAPQNNPLLQYQMGMSTLYPPTQKTPTTWDMLNNTIGAISGAGMSSSSGPGGSSTSLTF